MSSEPSNVASPVVREVSFAEIELVVLRQLVKDDYRKSIKYADKVRARLGDAFSDRQGYARSRRLAELHSKLGGSPVDLIVVDDR